jgi:DNA-binding transcriptional MocR family regulator
MEITYSRSGDYLIPDLTAGEAREPLTRYGIMRRNYLKENRQVLYNSLLLKGALNDHLLDIQEQARSRMELMMKQLQEQNPPPDKATDQMGWVSHMNSLRQTAEEVIKTELIYS